MKTYCNDGCKDSYLTDRQYGMIYPAMMIEEKLYGWDHGCQIAGICRYCREPLE